MRTIATALLVGALALWGCGEGNSGGKSGSAKGSQSTQTSSKTDGSGQHAKAAKNADADENLDRSTAEGTLGLFITHMQQGEFQDALLLTDPESSGYSQIEQAVNVLAESAKKGQDQGVSLEALMRAFMSRGWLGAVYEPQTVQDERARFQLKLVDHDIQTIDLRKIDGDWYVVAPDWIIVKGDVSDLLPSSAPSKPAQPTPTTKPAPTTTPKSAPPSGGGK